MSENTHRTPHPLVMRPAESVRRRRSCPSSGLSSQFLLSSAASVPASPRCEAFCVVSPCKRAARDPVCRLKPTLFHLQYVPIPGVSVSDLVDDRTRIYVFTLGLATVAATLHLLFDEGRCMLAKTGGPIQRKKLHLPPVLCSPSEHCNISFCFPIVPATVPALCLRQAQAALPTGRSCRGCAAHYRRDFRRAARDARGVTHARRKDLRRVVERRKKFIQVRKVTYPTTDRR